MDYVKNYLLVQGEYAVDTLSLAYLTSAHIPHMTQRDTNTLLVFNINKHYLSQYINMFHPSEWKWSMINDIVDVPKALQDAIKVADRTIAQNTFAYHSFACKDENSEPFVASSVHEGLSNKAFNGTGYKNWECRYYLSLGLLSTETSHVLAENAVEIYSSILKEAAYATATPVDDMSIHVYFDRHTFYSGAFPSDSTRLSYWGGIKKLMPLNREFTARIKQYGFERNLSNRCSIDGYLDMLGLKIPSVKDSVNWETNIRDYAIVPMTYPKKDKDILRHALVYGIDDVHKRYVIINISNDILRLIDLCDDIMYSRVIPSKEEEYAVFFDNVERQISYNVSLPYYTSLPNCRYRTEKKYDHLQGLDARATETREPIEDEPHRVIKLKIGYDEPFRLIEPYIADKVFVNFGKDYLTSMNIMCEDGSPIVKYFAFSWRDRSGGYNQAVEANIFTWFAIHDFVPIPTGALATGNTIVTFFKELLDNIPELREYFAIV